MFPHYKVDEQPKKKPKKGYFQKEEKARTKALWLLWKIVSHLGCVSQDSDALVSQGRKSWRNPMQKVLEPFQRVRFTKSTPRHASIREKEGRWENKCQSSSSAKSPTLWNLRTGPMQRLNDSSDVPEARLGILLKTFTSSKQIQGCILLSRGGMGIPGCVNKRAGGKRVCSWFRRLVCISSARKTLTLPSWRPWGYRKILRRWWRPMARCKPEKNPLKMSKN